MEKLEPITFDLFTIDPTSESLWRGNERIHLRPKSFAFLQYLVMHPGQMITKERLLNALWKDCFVGDGALKNCVAEIRRVLGDPAETPKYIETAHRRGYRFIGKMDHPPANGDPGTGSIPANTAHGGSTTRLVGRASELARLQQLLETSKNGIRQVAFVTGEQGIGKTTLIDAFLKSLDNGIWIARGQCIKTHGAGESYMPFAEAFTGLCDNSKRKTIVSTLGHHAPLWLIQMPSLVSAAQLRALRRTTSGASRERLLREMAEALEALTAEMPLILVLEDLHWSDYSTLDLISYWSQRRSASRLLLIGTYRLAETMTGDHPLRRITQELKAHNLCQEVSLAFLPESAVREYISHEFPDHSFPSEMATWIHRRTEGSPLFMINLLEHLVSRGLIVKRDGSWILDTPLERAELEVPPTIQQIIEQQFERCSREEQHLLQVASVAGSDFSASAVAAIAGEKPERVELRCRSLARRQLFLLPSVIRTTSGGKREARYSFSHVLYQNICYQLLTETRRAQLHQRVAEQIEQMTTSQSGDFAARLAAHFDLGRKTKKAVQYYEKAAANANWRYAGRETQELAERGLQLLETIPATTERCKIELSLQIALGSSLLATKGLVSPEMKRAFDRAMDLFRQLDQRRSSGNTPLFFSALWGLWNYSWIRADYVAARETAERLYQLAQKERDPSILTQAHYALGIILMDHGEFAEALQHLNQCPTVVSRIYGAWTMWNLGYPDRAIKSLEDTLARSMAMKDTEGSIFSDVALARVHAARRENQKALDHAQSALQTARQNGFPKQWLAPWQVILGWAMVKLGRGREGIDEANQALAAHREIGSTNITPYVLALFGEILGDAGRPHDGIAAIDEALDVSAKTGLIYHEAEIHRLRGELLLRKMISGKKGSLHSRGLSDVEAHFKKSIRIARRQQAKSIELRAAVSMAKLWEHTDRRQKGRQQLQEVYEWFKEGFETADLQDARNLLGRL